MRAFRLLRGMVSTAIAWGLAWAVLGAAYTMLTGLVRGYNVPLGTYASVAFSAALFYAIVGVWAGGIFAAASAATPPSAGQPVGPRLAASASGS